MPLYQHNSLYPSQPHDFYSSITLCRQYSDEHYIFHYNLFNLFLHRPKYWSGGIKCGCIQLALYTLNITVSCIEPQ